MGMLTNTYQMPAAVKCQRPPGMAYQVGALTAIRLCHSHSPKV